MRLLWVLGGGTLALDTFRIPKLTFFFRRKTVPSRRVA